LNRGSTGIKKTVPPELELLLASTLVYAVGQQFRGNRNGLGLSLQECPGFVDEDEVKVSELFPNEGQTLWHWLSDGNLRRMNRPTKTRVIKETSPIAEAGVQFRKGGRSPSSSISGSASTD
jgi:hypothetical protein